MNFFREEALAARRAGALGAIRLAQPWGFALTAACALLLAAAFIAFVSYAQVTRKTAVAGVLAPRGGEARVVPVQAGVVAAIHVKDGDAVAKDQPLFTLSLARVTERGDVTQRLQASLDARRAALQSEARLQATLASQKSISIEARIRNAEGELAHAQDEHTLVQRRAALAQASESRYRQLVRDGFVSEAQLQQKQEESLDAATRARAASRTVLTLERELEAIRAERWAIEGQSDIQQAQSRRGMAALAQEEAEFDARALLVVLAPADGTVAMTDLHVGKSVEANQPLLSILPPGAGGELVAHLYTTSHAIGHVAPGQRAWLHYDAFPYQRFGLGSGAVVAVSRTPVAAPGPELRYRVDIALDSQFIAAYGQAQRLKPGMAVQVDLVRERLALWQWALDPLLAARARAGATL